MKKNNHSLEQIPSIHPTRSTQPAYRAHGEHATERAWTKHVEHEGDDQNTIKRRTVGQRELAGPSQERVQHPAYPPRPEGEEEQENSSGPTAELKAFEQVFDTIEPSNRQHALIETPQPASSLFSSQLIDNIDDIINDFDDTELPEGKVLHDGLNSHLIHLSGMMKAIRPSQQGGAEEWWPDGIKQTGAIPVVNLYGNEPFGRSKPGELAVQEPAGQPLWRRVLNAPAFKVTLGLLVGIGLLLLVARVVDIPTTVAILQKNLTTPRGILFALLSGVAFLGAFSVRGVRWKLFLNTIGNVSTLKAIQLFLVGIFLNFLLPIRGGEVAKSLILKRTANIPISSSLPTVAMDKALDLMPALFIIAIVPFLGVQMDIKLWLVLGAVSGLLVGLIFFVGLAAWKRQAAIALLQKLTHILPKGLGDKVAGFATGFVDSLLAGASRPRIFIPAVLLTIVAVILDGLFAMLAFWTVGVPISFGTAIFGYTVYNMFYILPTPPGQVGSNEAVGLLVFYGLLHLDSHGVTAMFFFSHPWAALLMCVAGMGSLSALGLKISSAMQVQTGGSRA